MFLDAIVLAGGRSSRLGGSAKAALVYEGQTLLARTVAATSSARRVVVVGDVAALPLADRLDDHVLVTREDPPFGGPAAAIYAGAALLGALETEPSDYTLVLACDMPEVGVAVPALLTEVERRTGDPRHIDGVVAVDERQHPQHLLAVYRTASLSAALDSNSARLDGLSMRALVADLELRAVSVPPGSTGDIDTWADAAAHGIPRMDSSTAPDAPAAPSLPASPDLPAATDVAASPSPAPRVKEST